MNVTKVDSNIKMEIFLIPVDSHYSKYDAVLENQKLFHINPERDTEISNSSTLTNSCSSSSESESDVNIRITEFLKNDWSYRIKSKKLIIYKTLVSKIQKKVPKNSTNKRNFPF